MTPNAVYKEAFHIFAVNESLYTYTFRELSNKYRFVTIKLSIFDFIDSRTWIFLPDKIDDQIMYVFKPKFFLVIASPLDSTQN